MIASTQTLVGQTANGGSGMLASGERETFVGLLG